MNFSRRLKISLIACLIGAATPILASLPSYYAVKSIPFNESSTLLFTPGANPAYFTTLDDYDLGYTWAGSHQSLAYIGLPGLGFGIHNQDNSADYRLQTGWGDSGHMTGVGLVWGAGYGARCSMAWQLGKIVRLSPQVSLGGEVLFETGQDAGQQGVLNFGFRPQGTESLTLSGDGVVDHDRSFEWSLSATSVVIPGCQLGLRYFSDKTIMAGVAIDWGTWEVGVHNGPDSLTSVELKSSPGPHIMQNFRAKPKRYVELHLGGDIRYQRFQWFDHGETLLGILETIRRAKNDPEIMGMALDLSQFNADYAFCWEIRNALAQFKQSGKKIIAYLEEGELRDYYVASVADWVVLDPMGGLELVGPTVTKTYYKGLLTKLGVSIDEIRLFKYKSAYEPLAREQMSTADREQQTALIDRRYAQIQNDIAQSRQVSPNQFEKWLNQSFRYSAKSASANHLVDQLGRWEDVKAKWTSWNATSVGVGEGFLYRKRPQVWGDKPVIAVVYAIGICDMDSGIKARNLAKIIEGLVKDSDVKAIVLRIDSPGGSGLASDIVAKEMKKGRDKKPIIVSQGDLAASGGYWLSAYGTSVLTTPFTLTGSIGVISMWMYDHGFDDMTGLRSETIGKGKFADLFQGVRIPIVGITLHTRPLNEDERTIWDTNIKESYQDFLDLVCDGRKKTRAEIEPIAQGRVWAGSDALRLGLVDQLGGLDSAITAAKKAAGIPDKAEIEIAELPEKGLWDLHQLIPIPRIPGLNLKADATTDSDLETLEFELRHNGEALPLM